MTAQSTSHSSRIVGQGFRRFKSEICNQDRGPGGARGYLTVLPSAGSYVSEGQAEDTPGLTLARRIRILGQVRGRAQEGDNGTLCSFAQH